MARNGTLNGKEIGQCLPRHRQKRIRQGTFPSVTDLVATTNRYIEFVNAIPKPFAWTATVEAILSKVKHANEVIDTPH